MINKNTKLMGLGLGLAITATSQAAIIQSFESYTIGEQWGTGSSAGDGVQDSSGDTTVTIENDAETSSKVFSFVSTTTSTRDANINIPTISALDDGIIFQFDAKFSAGINNGVVGMTDTTSAGGFNTLSAYVQVTGGSLLYRDGSSTTAIVGVDSTAWNNYRFVLNNTTETYDVFVNGSQVGTGASYRNPNTNGDLLGVEVISRNGTVLVDNLEIVPEPSSTALLGLGGLALILRRRK